jgi:hypothetical protein
VLAAGSLDEVIVNVDRALLERKLEPTRHGGLTSLRAAKRSEPRGHVEIPAGEWFYKERRS